MPGTKRSTKAVSYSERNDDDDDDFIPAFDNTKKTRHSKLNDQQIETKSSTRPPPRKRKEKLSKIEQEELDLALKLSKQMEQSIEIPIVNDDKQSETSQSNESTNENKTITKEEKIYEQNENISPKNKRIKREEEIEGDDQIDEEDDEKEEEQEEQEEQEEEEEEEKPTPRKKSTRKTEETKQNSETTSIDNNSSRSVTRAQQKSSISTSDVTNKTKPNVPLGFPTSKINLVSMQTSRVGLSRKSSAIKPLHRNLNQRVVHE